MPRGVSPLDEARLQRRLWTPDLLPAPFRPNLWLDAMDLSTITAGTGVSGWRDKSGRANNAAMATTANQPTYQPTGFLGGPTLRFSGASQRLQVAHAASLDSTEYSFFGAVIDDGVSGSFRAWLEKSVNTGQTSRKYWIGVSNIDQFWDISENATVTSTGTVTKAPQVVAAVKPTTQAVGPARFFQNGVQTASDATFTNVTGNTSVLSIGGTFYPWNGRVAEVIFIPAAVPDYVRWLIEGYLAWRRGMRLAAAHPYRNRPPLIGV